MDVYMHVNTCMYVYVHLYVSVCLCVCVSGCVRASMCTCIRMCISVSAPVPPKNQVVYYVTETLSGKSLPCNTGLNYLSMTFRSGARIPQSSFICLPTYFFK